jgi:hypothetical protein
MVKKRSDMKHYRLWQIAAVMLMLVLAGAFAQQARASDETGWVGFSSVAVPVVVDLNFTPGIISNNGGTVSMPNGVTMGNTLNITAGGATITGGTSTDTLTSAGTTGLNVNTNAATNINSGTSTGNVTIGNSANTTSLNSATNNIGVTSLTGAATTNAIGNASAAFNATNTIGNNSGTGTTTSTTIGANSAAGATTNGIGANSGAGYTLNSMGALSGSSATAYTSTAIGGNSNTNSAAYTTTGIGSLASGATGYTTNGLGVNNSTTASAYTTNGVGTITGAGYTVNGMGNWTGGGSGYSTNTIGNTNASTTATTLAGNSYSSVINNAASLVSNAYSSISSSNTPGATQGTSAGVSLVMRGATGTGAGAGSSAPQFLVNNWGNIVQASTPTAQNPATSSSAFFGMTNGLGNTHGVVVQENQTTISGGYHSTSMTLSDYGATFRNATGGAATVTGVADGQARYDAVNYGQLREVYGGVAAAAALAGIPNPIGQNKYSIGMGYGNFLGVNAFAFGAKAALTKNLMLQAGVGFSPNNDHTWSAGIGYSF